MRRLLVVFVLSLLCASRAAAQSPCDLALTQRTLFPITATSIPVAVDSPDHADPTKVAEYVVRVFAAGGTTVLNEQVVARSAATLVTGTTSCYRLAINKVAPLVADTDYTVRVLARGPAGEGALTQVSNPFAFTSPARLGNVRVPPAP